MQDEPAEVRVLLEQELTEKIIGAAMEVHRNLGPGLLESAYEECLSFELEELKIPHRRQVPQRLIYKGLELECGYKLDLVVDRRVVIEIKAVERVLPIHEAQLITYLRLSRIQVGLLLNFNVSVMKDGIVRRALSIPTLSASSASPR